MAEERITVAGVQRYMAESGWHGIVQSIRREPPPIGAIVLERCPHRHRFARAGRECGEQMLKRRARLARRT